MNTEEWYLQPSRISEEIGGLIRAAREGAGMTQDAVAAATGIARPNISRIESGRHVPSLVTIYKISFVLRVSPSSLVGE